MPLSLLTAMLAAFPCYVIAAFILVKVNFFAQISYLKPKIF